MNRMKCLIVGLVAVSFLAGCKSNETGLKEENEVSVTQEAGLENEKADDSPEDKDEITDIYKNTISDEVKSKAKSFPSIDGQYHSWRGTQTYEMGEYAWVSTEPYVSKMDEYVEKYDDVDWTLVENGSQYNEATIDAIKSSGYNFVRILLDTRYFFTDDEYFNVESTGEVFNGSIDTYNAGNWQKLDQVISWCIERDIHVCFDVHSTPGGYMIGGDEEASREGLFSQTDSSDADIFLLFWQQAAVRYSDVDSKALSFNLYNEPPNFMSERQEDYVDLMAKAVDRIRDVSPDRLIFIDTLEYSTRGMDNIDKLKQYDNIIYSFHYYSNYQWTSEEMLEGDWKTECDDRIKGYDDWAKENDVKWMLQEYGIQSDMHSLETREEYISYLLNKVEEYEVPYTLFNEAISLNSFCAFLERQNIDRKSVV